MLSRWKRIDGHSRFCLRGIPLHETWDGEGRWLQHQLLSPPPAERPCRGPAVAVWAVNYSKAGPSNAAILSILRHRTINLVRPGGKAAFDALEMLEAALAQEAHGLKGTHAGMAVNIVMPLRVQLREALR